MKNAAALVVALLGGIGCSTPAFCPDDSACGPFVDLQIGSRSDAVALADLAVSDFSPAADQLLVDLAPATGPPDLAAGRDAVDGADRAFFDPERRVATGANPQTALAADLDGDGHLDVALANHVGGDVSLLFGNGDGTFVVGARPVAGFGPQTIAGADFNRDGIADLVVSNVHGGTLSVLLGAGQRGFQPQVSVPVEAAPYGLAAADLDGDRLVDLATVDAVTGHLELLKGRGDGTFAAPVNLGGPVNPRGMRSADLDGDGLIDLAVADLASARIDLFLGGGFAFPLRLMAATGPSPLQLTIADLDLDGHLDLLVPNDNGVTLLYGIGLGAFRAPIAVPAGMRADSVAVADFDGDGRLDLAVSDLLANQVHLLLAPQFASAADLAVGVGPVAVIAADLDGDGRADLIVVNGDSDDLSVFLARH